MRNSFGMDYSDRCGNVYWAYTLVLATRGGEAAWGAQVHGFSFSFSCLSPGEHLTAFNFE